MEPLSIRFSEPSMARIDARCARLGINRSEYVRRAVDAQLDAEETTVELQDLRERVRRLELGAGGRR